MGLESKSSGSKYDWLQSSRKSYKASGFTCVSCFKFGIEGTRGPGGSDLLIASLTGWCNLEYGFLDLFHLQQGAHRERANNSDGTGEGAGV